MDTETHLNYIDVENEKIFSAYKTFFKDGTEEDCKHRYLGTYDTKMDFVRTMTRLAIECSTDEITNQRVKEEDRKVIAKMEAGEYLMAETGEVFLGFDDEQDMPQENFENCTPVSD